MSMILSLQSLSALQCSSSVQGSFFPSTPKCPEHVHTKALQVGRARASLWSGLAKFAQDEFCEHEADSGPLRFMLEDRASLSSAEYVRMSSKGPVNTVLTHGKTDQLHTLKHRSVNAGQASRQKRPHPWEGSLPSSTTAAPAARKRFSPDPATSPTVGRERSCNCGRLVYLLTGHPCL